MLAAILEDTPLPQNTTKETHGDHKAGEWGDELIGMRPAAHFASNHSRDQKGSRLHYIDWKPISIYRTEPTGS